ncbi:methyltransferase-like protein 25 isoform X1 [Megalops cyprinoides]|uniref:methyltransferase-like protein 25 isoform X1 n=1 Tax=Megalops cyprinoides TaxID=118141 RepID=UPI0018646B3E|nr:methyltransferase-like protein 25 isoform X1 [Megalops cyprinoides]
MSTLKMSYLESIDIPLVLIKRKLSHIKEFLEISLSIANAHTVDFYTHHVWDEFIAVPPQSVLSVINSSCVQRMTADRKRNTSCTRSSVGRDKTRYGFCDESKRLVDVAALLDAAKGHALAGLEVCVPLSQLLRTIQGQDELLPAEEDVPLEPDEFMNSKKSHEVQILSKLVASLAKHCRVQQVIDVGSGKGYLCSFLSMRYGLKVYGIDSSSSNTHGAQERNRKLKRFSKAYRRHGRARLQGGGAVGKGKEGKGTQGESDSTTGSGLQSDRNVEGLVPVHEVTVVEVPFVEVPTDSPAPSEDEEALASAWSMDLGGPDPENPFIGILSPELSEQPCPRVPPSELSAEERERRKRENLERKSARGGSDGALYSPLTSYVTAETELRDIITELEDALVVGLHTCGDLASSTLRMFVSRQELRAVCSVGCCYHLLSEEFDQLRQGSHAGNHREHRRGPWGFPMSQFLRDQAGFCGRNARMSACLALERVAAGQGLPTESLFYRAVLHVILRDHYKAIKSEKRVGNVYSKATSFVDYVRRALKKLDLDEAKLSDSLIQDYHDKYRPRMQEMEAFNMLKVSLAPCIEGLILLDRLCYLKEQENTAFSALVQLFDPLRSPRCYGIISIKKQRTMLTLKHQF